MRALSDAWSPWARTSTATRWRASSPQMGYQSARWSRTWARSPCAAASSTSSARSTSGRCASSSSATPSSRSASSTPRRSAPWSRSRRCTLLPGARGALHRRRRARAPRPPPAPPPSASTCPPSSCASGSSRIREGIPGFGMEALLPGFFEGGLATVFDYLPFWAPEPLFYLDDPVGLDRAAEELWDGDRAQLCGERHRAEELALPPEEHFLDARRGRRALARLRACSRAAGCRSPGRERRRCASPSATHAGPARGHPRAPRRGGRADPAGGAAASAGATMRVAAAIACGTRARRTGSSGCCWTAT